MNNDDAPRTIMTSLHIADRIDGVLHFIPCAVTENVAGYRPMGKPQNGLLGPRTIMDPMPWYWGNTNAECQELCDSYNRDTFGIEPLEAMKIVASSMRAQNSH